MPTPEPGVPFTTGGVDDMTQDVIDRQAVDAAAVVDSLDELTDVDLTGAAEGDVLTVQADGSIAPQSATTVAVDDEGVEVVAAASTLDFAGAGVTVTDGGAGTATVTIPGGGAGSANLATIYALGG